MERFSLAVRRESQTRPVFPLSRSRPEDVFASAKVIPLGRPSPSFAFSPSPSCFRRNVGTVLVSPVFRISPLAIVFNRCIEITLVFFLSVRRPFWLVVSLCFSLPSTFHCSSCDLHLSRPPTSMPCPFLHSSCEASSRASLLIPSAMLPPPVSQKLRRSH